MTHNDQVMKLQTAWSESHAFKDIMCLMFPDFDTRFIQLKNFTDSIFCIRVFLVSEGKVLQSISLDFRAPPLKMRKYHAMLCHGLQAMAFAPRLVKGHCCRRRAVVTDAVITNLVNDAVIINLVNDAVITNLVVSLIWSIEPAKASRAGVDTCGKVQVSTPQR